MPAPAIEKVLKERKKEKYLEELKRVASLSEGLSFSAVVQKKPLGDGHAILQAYKAVKGEPVAVLFADDIVDSDVPCLAQLKKVFKTCEKPILALYKIERERIPFYGIVEPEKIASRFYKIKKIVEKPPLKEAPSDLAVVGKYILTPEVFDYLKKAKVSEKGEILLAEVLERMISAGKMIYGYEFEGRWLECGNKLSWLQSHIYFSLKHPEYGPKLKQFLKNLKYE